MTFILQLRIADTVIFYGVRENAVLIETGVRSLSPLRLENPAELAVSRVI